MKISELRPRRRTWKCCSAESCKRSYPPSLWSNNDPDLKVLLEEKRSGIMSKATSWRSEKAVESCSRAIAIALAHEGNMQLDGTLRRLRESQWFLDKRKQVQLFVDSCKCATANPRNPKPPLKLRPMSKEPWKITTVDYKGPIGPQRWYLHSQLSIKSWYPKVYMTKSTSMSEVKKVLDKAMGSCGNSKEIWSDGGPPYNSHKWV